MGQSQSQLQSILETVPGVKKVYFQPPASVRMVYPCIRYNWATNYVRYADNFPYHVMRRYDLIVIDEDPASPIPEAVCQMFPYCSMGNSYVADNLHHFPITLYY